MMMMVTRCRVFTSLIRLTMTHIALTSNGPGAESKRMPGPQSVCGICDQTINSERLIERLSHCLINSSDIILNQHILNPRPLVEGKLHRLEAAAAGLVMQSSFSFTQAAYRQPGQRLAKSTFT